MQKTILIVEDDPSIAAALDIRLRALGHFTLLAGDAVQAGCLGLQHQPDLVLLDISLPGGSGLLVAERFSRMPEMVGTPIIFLTATRDPELHRQALDLHPAAFFEKPYDTDELMAAVTCTLNRPHAQRRSVTLNHSLNLNPDLPRNRNRNAKPGKRILIVEDDEHIAMALALRLKEAGHDTALAFDAVLGLSTAVRSAPDLVVLDITMPGGNGLHLAQRMQELMPDPPPVIFLTASKQPALREKAFKLGAVAFFEKPYEAEDLLAAVESSFTTSTSVPTSKNGSP